MKRIGVLMTFVALATVFYSCKDQGVVVVPENAIYDELASLERFDVAQQGTKVFRTREEWQAFFMETFRYPLSTEPIQVPRIDFNNEMVVGVFWGSGRYSGCTKISRSIEYIRNVGNRIEVKVGTVRDLGRCRMMISPLYIVKTPKSDLPVVFVGNPPGL